MNSDQLKQFKAIAECGSITKASEKLYITQPALSMALSRLEEELARPLFLRDGRRLVITQDGEKLLYYANMVCDSLERAEDYFRVKEYSQLIKLYRIGGTAINLLTEGCYHLPDYRINCVLIKNSDVPKIVGSGMADLVVSDERYMNLAMHKFVEKEFLYHQQLMLCVAKDDPLAKYDVMDVKDLEEITMVGRVSPIGFNDWLNDIKGDNRVEFNEEINIDNMTYFAERDKLPWPYLMSSFGIGTARGKEYFEKRKLIRITGEYTERDIYVYWNSRNRKNLKPMIDLIKDNAKRILALDEGV